MQLRRNRNLIALITGASSGIGRATARELAQRGVHVVLTSRREDRLQELASEIASAGGTVTVRRLDVTDRQALRGTVADIERQCGVIEILVANAGEYIRGEAATLGSRPFEQSMAINFYGALDLIYEVLPSMLRRKAGHIVVVSTVDAKKGLPLDAPYVAAKAAITGFMDVLRQELRGSGVHVTTVLPGRVDTPMIQHLRVPWISPKISPNRVARALVRAIERNRAEVIVPWVGPKTLLLAGAVSAPIADSIVRLFHLEGEKQSP
jgi:short-subunit dehydrogenase